MPLPIKQKTRFLWSNSSAECDNGEQLAQKEQISNEQRAKGEKTELVCLGKKVSTLRLQSVYT